jgi:hypothetical protein
MHEDYCTDPSTLAEWASALGLSAKALRQHIKAGRLKAINVDGVYRMTDADVLAFMGEYYPMPPSTPDIIIEPPRWLHDMVRRQAAAERGA